MIYFDNSATTKPDKEVLAAFNKVNEEFYFNPASPHAKGIETEKLLDSAREQIRKLLKLDQQSIIFTSGATESNNLLLTGMARAKKQFGRTIITTKLEHPSVLETVRALEEEGFNIEYMRFKEDGALDLEHLESLLTSDVILVAMMHVNNVMGAILPVAEVAAMVQHYPRIHFHVDCVQSFGKVPLQLEGVHSFSLSGHKFHGLKGQGLLVFSQLKTITHTLFGGGQEYGFRSGTVNVASAVAMSRAIRLTLDDYEMQRARLYQMKEEIERYVKQFPGIQLNSQHNGAPHIVNLSFVGVKGEVIVNAFSKRGIMVSTTSACSSKRAKLNETLTALHVSDEAITGSIRISLSKNNTAEEVHTFNAMFREIYEEVEELLKK
ncbi:cysteine desulfurase family protein [Macrococcus bovicus]|uniref:cysteine desulfurase family protein n=1 Tax=Macrococcus bovicus TaxID=69968 RepID=UPI0025A5EF04|nr:cysteine desulfurase family protein [Macrococcus bovicus]WJP97187.1 cysteine desulfurase family protein [Macrococcus bovicus]